MNEPNEKITPIKNSEDLQRLAVKYETKIEDLKQKALDWENTAIAEKAERLDLKANLEAELSKAIQDRDIWKREAMAARTVYQEKEKVVAQADFITELAKLQAKRGINIEA
jgi:hypothetical protein